MRYWLRNMVALGVTAVFLFSAANLTAQTSNEVNDLYDIAYNGEEITLDGNLDDWSDAHWRFLSQDRPAFTEIVGVPDSPSDFSGYYALKMDDENLYMAVRVRDEGQPMIDTETIANFNMDAMTLYIGLYDIGDRAASPHEEIIGGDSLYYMHPTIEDSTVASGRTYRISPSSDNTGTTLGADYQMVLRAMPYQGGNVPENTDAMRYAYNYGIVDNDMPETSAAGKLDSTSTGYMVEWKIPFSSLSGKISNPEGSFADFEWPEFTPEHGKVVPFDVDLTDIDEEGGNTVFLREGSYGALWRDSFGYKMRGRIVDVSAHPNQIPNEKYYIEHKESQEITLDGNLDDWSSSYFKGLSQDRPTFTEIVGVPDSPSDFSGYYALKMDNENLYMAVRVRDEGQPMIDTETIANFNMDAMTLYTGLFDIGDRAMSPHQELIGGDSLYYIHPTIDDSTVASGRTYRISPSSDNTGTTLGADYQLVLRALPYQGGNVPENTDAMRYAYNYGIVDNDMPETMAGGALDSTSTGYMVEWKIPLSSLSGKISNPDGSFADFEWPQFEPDHGKVIPFDVDLTDIDEEGGNTIFLREGSHGPLWRDSYAYKMHGEIVQVNTGTSIEDDFTVKEEVPSNIQLDQNYPNPFNPTTNISFALPEAQKINLTVYNMLGQKVATLVEGVRGAGNHTVQFNGAGLSSGMYIYRLETPSAVQVHKMILLK